jgi:hypothetical protein
MSPGPSSGITLMVKAGLMVGYPAIVVCSFPLCKSKIKEEKGKEAVTIFKVQGNINSPKQID